MGETYLIVQARLRNLALILLIAPVLLFATPSATAEEKSIVWAMNDFPPNFIFPDGKLPTTVAELGQGYGDRSMANIIARLPQYRHQFLQANVPRIMAQMEHGSNLCFASVNKTPSREKFAYFTPIFLHPPMGLVVLRDRQSTSVLQSAPQSLANILKQHKDFQGYVESGRSYNPDIDSLISQDNASLRKITVPNTGHLLRMLDAGRMDYTLEYPMMVEYQSEKMIVKNKMSVIPLVEAPDWIASYVACTRNPWGQERIHDIEVAIHDAARSQAFRDALNHWIPPEYLAEHRVKLKGFYDDLAKNPH
ncbi:MAG TPA: TIGR02285 family protein [Burkholderiaceae bacterium]|nr:TIGR02285 family protein [Burkholderiaceae bacterium]